MGLEWLVMIESVLLYAKKRCVLFFAMEFALKMAVGGSKTHLVAFFLQFSYLPIGDAVLCA